VRLKKELEIRTGQKFVSTNLVFRNFSEEYLSWYVTMYPSSFFRSEQIIRQHLMPVFEFVALDEIKIRMADQYMVARKRAGAKSGTIIKEMRVLKAMLNQALRWEYLDKDPLKNLQLPKSLDSKPPRFYTPEELETIYCWAPYNWHWWRLMANTGLRRKEALQLEWGHIDSDKINILSTEQDRSKSGLWRPVPLSSGARYALKRFERDRVDDYVFPRVNRNSLSRAFDRVVTRADIAEPKGSLHCLRHTFASTLVQKGVPLRVIQKLLGHADYTTTERYAHLAPDFLHQVVTDLEI